MSAALQRHPQAVAAAAGVALGAAYSLSPMTVLCVPLLVVLAMWAGRGLSESERRWFVSLIAAAVLLRLAVIAVLFLTADPAHPFATLFGDEQFFKSRALWMRNIGLGVGVSGADIIYAYDEVGRSSYLYLLAYLQALLGDLPYGVHVMNATLYLAGVLLVYRYVRPVFGEIAALAGLSLLLFFPSLFVWSISALKEPIYTLVAVGELLCCLWLVRARLAWHRVAAAAGLVLAIFALESLRRGGMLVGIAGAFGGLVLGTLGSRPRLAWAALAMAPVMAVALLAVPQVHDRLLGVVRMTAVYHGGHIMSEGYSYKILDSRYYHDRNLVAAMPTREAAQFVVRSVISYVTEPVPWRAESAGLRAYLPEQMFWYVLLAFVPFGLVAGFRLDPLLTGLLASHASALIVMVALTSGNIGTLIRHRGLALPYLAWLAGLGFCRVVNYLISNRQVEGVTPHGDR
ncbi:MAG: hypothetical protein Q8O42_01760 [Acidobacteriota bacterium]|nr:hypothetical protein [Acidobacteriota bacterium]